MKKLLLLTTLFLVFNCSKDEGDGDDNSNENQTFLQKYDGYGFTYDDEYRYFYDDVVFMKWVSDVCLEIREGSNTVYADGDGGEYNFNVALITNDSERLVFRLIEEDDRGTYTETIEFSVNPSGNALTEMIDNDDEDLFTLFRTETSYSSACSSLENP